LAGLLDDLLVKPDENVSGLQAIKANPSKPSVDAMLTLVGKLRVIEATGALGVDLSWLNANYQRALFHQVRKSSVTRLRELAEPRRRAALVCFLWQSYCDFLSQRLKPIVINQNEIDRRAWECALLLKLRDELKAGNLSVRYSKRFARLEEFFIDDRRWQG